MVYRSPPQPEPPPRLFYALFGHFSPRNHALSLLLPADLNNDCPAAGAVELTKENSLPCAELQSSALEQDLLAAADQAAFTVRVGIAFEMPVARPVGRQ